LGATSTGRFPKKLDRAAIVARLGELHEWARSEGLAELAALLALTRDASGGEIGSRVLSALDWVAGKSEYAAVTKQLERLALSLKNLR
jgi:hypothetical protein